MKRLRRIVGLAAIGVIGVLAVIVPASATYHSTPLSHGGYCYGYGWADSAYPYGVYAGTTYTSGSGPCYRKVDSYIVYNGGNVYDPLSTGYQTYDVLRGAGPQGPNDVASAQHWLSWTGGDLGAGYGTTYAAD
jgi:hypothetical protein